MRLQCFRLQKTQLGRKLLRICCSNLSCTPACQVSTHRSGFRRPASLASAGALTQHDALTPHSLTAGSKQCVGRVEFCCPRMRGGVRVVPARERGRIWLAQKARRDFWQATAFFTSTEQWGSNCYFQEDLSHLPKADRHHMLWLSAKTVPSRHSGKTPGLWADSLMLQVTAYFASVGGVPASAH